MTERFPFSISYWTGPERKVSHLRAGKHFRFDLDAVNKFCLADLPLRLVDLLRIGSGIYVVDRLVKRRSKTGSAKRARTLGVKIGVLDAAFWNRSEVHDTIGEALDFLSGDFWELEFVQDTELPSRAMRLLPDPHDGKAPLICLYSGGLDSAAGFATRIAESPARPMIPVTVWHQPRQRSMVRTQFGVIRRRLPSQIDPLIVKVAMIWSSDLDRKQQEHSQRCRSFLFAVLGAITAIMHGQHSVELFESGVGAINLPLMAGMVGWKTTRSSHPAFLRLMSRLASLVAETQIGFDLPYFCRTKGELVQKLAELNLEELAALTGSCVGYPLRHSEEKHCGVCPACLFRRQAMHVAKIPEAERTYKHDIFEPPLLSGTISVDRLKYLKAFLMQVEQLSDIEITGRLPRVFERHVLSTGILRRDQSQKEIIDLLVRYRNEWRGIATSARRMGHRWASWIVPEQKPRQGVSYVSA
jgi:Queuosine biosynthesis protein QueC